MLKYIDERIEQRRSSWIQEFIRYLEGLASREGTWWKAADNYLPGDINPPRGELDIYFYAVRIFSTTLGGISQEKPGAR